MYLLRSVDVWSCARVTGVLYGCMGLLLIPMALISIVASAASPQGYSTLGATALILLSLFAPVIYGLLGFILGALSAWLYNVTAKYVGGIRLELRDANSIGGSTKGIGLI
jgi:transmembrane protein DUF3566